MVLSNFCAKWIWEEDSRLTEDNGLGQKNQVGTIQVCTKFSKFGQQRILEYLLVCCFVVLCCALLCVWLFGVVLSIGLPDLPLKLYRVTQKGVIVARSYCFGFDIFLLGFTPCLFLSCLPKPEHPCSKKACQWKANRPRLPTGWITQ